jgi:SSS family solute:Na+ symporter
VISLFTKRTKTDDELRGLVYSLTPRQSDAAMAWYKRPVTLGILILVVSTILNVIFW